jgi:hypothetical protein
MIQQPSGWTKEFPEEEKQREETERLKTDLMVRNERMTFVPASITTQILSFCHLTNPQAEPAYIAVTPEVGCRPLDCFGCVRQRVERDGGRVQFGWSIWEWPRVAVQFEHHAVYEPSDGPPWYDITPAYPTEVRRRLFLPDNNAPYDYSVQGSTQDNKRFALSDDPLIQDFFAASAKRVSILKRSAQGDVVTRVELSEAEKEKDCLFLELQMKYTAQTAFCYCGSGARFKRCCGRTFGPSVARLKQEIKIIESVK